MKKLEHRFVEAVPDILQEGVLYISIPYCTAIHKCVCGCGNEVVTPLSPVGWKLTYDGETVSLYPSIGSWQLKCQSHYFITNNCVEHARKWSKWKIDQSRKGDESDRDLFYKKRKNKH